MNLNIITLILISLFFFLYLCNNQSESWFIIINLFAILLINIKSLRNFVKILLGMFNYILSKKKAIYILMCFGTNEGNELSLVFEYLFMLLARRIFYVLFDKFLKNIAFFSYNIIMDVGVKKYIINFQRNRF